ncbi:RNA-directed DNA polymerase from transposon BS [Paramuricea clavata]|uniref:RNA-directed DNA polymerase from transposon BS n=1 Tax=Paramuricea clavata TaxID=317549 RepID=A0A6S7H7I8_PARCT|nr:RNA-directed DNA polymerase from transposon BS [Paramuricea clavata]
MECIFMCLNEDGCCRSVNYKKNSLCDEKENCELPHVTPAEEPGLLKEHPDYDHYVLLQPNRIDQLIKESTRLTPKSATLIDLILTNRPENISRSGVIHLGIPDHSLVYAVRKFSLPKGRQKIRQVRNFENFVENDFIRDVSQLPWEMVYQFGDPNLCWQVWKSLLLDALNRHAPLRHKRIRNNPVPWINPQIKELMRKRDYHKKKAIKYDSESQWELYNTLRNEVNINMRKAKSKYFCDKIQASSQMGDSKSSWAWINSLLGRKHKNANINELKVNDDIISDDKSITETLNEYFINIGMKMAAESACQSTDALNDQVIYESTLLLPKENFHFADITIDSVSKRLQKLNVSKATGALIQMCDQWLQDMDEGKINGVVFLDICKAFDSVNHEILLEKLKTQFGIHDIELKWFQSYLRNRKQVCSVNDQTSSARTIICGIPQGSILGPLLFLLYINDMPDILERTTPCLYTDDTQISSSSHDYDTLIDNLNMDLSSIHKWLAKNKLKYHSQNIKVMFIGSTHNLNHKIGNRPDSTKLNCPDFPCLNGGRCVGGCGNKSSFCNCSRSYAGKYCDKICK